MNFLKIPVPFFRRKVRQRTSLKKYHFIFAKFLRFQRTFYKKFFGRGLGRTAPTDNAYKKTRCKPRFFNLSEYVGTAVPNLRFKGLFVKSPLKIRKNFCSNTPLYFDENFLKLSVGIYYPRIEHKPRKISLSQNFINRNRNAV